jgi:TolB-like protein/Flp pilus assembly protein TadD
MSLIAELKRRNVFRVGVAYAIVAWLLVEVSSVFLPALRLPEWTLTLLVFLVVVGFPLALIFAWAFELTPEGIKPAKDVAPAESIRQLTGRKMDFAIIGLLAIALIFVVVDNYVLEAEPEKKEVTAESAPATEPVVRGKSIAVLPLANRSANEEDAFFVDGIHDDILTQISKIRALKVISRTSVMEYRNTTKNLKTIGQELGAATVLEGGVQRAGDRVRINVQLIDAATDEHLWADTYDRRLTAANIFAIQTEIATAIADALRAALSPEEQDRLATIPTENLAAYEAYLLGRQRLAKETNEAVAEAIAYFQQAIKRDPNFALAYVGLADAYTWQSYQGGVPPEEGFAKAQVAVDKALALDGGLGEAYTSLAKILQERGDSEGAEATYQRALELNPNYAPAYYWYGFLLRFFLDRPEEALTLFRKAVELDPLSAATADQLGISLQGLGRFEEGLVWFKRAIEVDPGYSGGYQSIASHYLHVLGQLDEFVVWQRKAFARDPGNPNTVASHGQAFLDLGDLDEAEYWINRSIELGPESFWPNIVMQLLHLYRGDEAAALEYGRKALAIYTDWPARILLQDYALRAGRYMEVRAFYEESHPDFLNDDDPEIDDNLDGNNYWLAINLALALSKTGEQERADLLLDRSFQHILTVPRLGIGGHWIADVQIYALQGEKQKALSALRQAIDEGWRRFWWYHLKYDPTLESLHDEPEFQAMIAEIEADMAAQLERVREMERNGELALPAELPAPGDRASNPSPTGQP